MTSAPSGPDASTAAPAASLRSRAASGLAWSAASHGGRSILLLVTQLAIMRLVGPEDFGLVAIALVVVQMATMFREVGTGSALIQVRQLSGPLVDSVFWLNVALGLALGAVLLVTAPLAAAFYREPLIAPILRALAVTPILSSLGVVPTALLERSMDFTRLARREIAAVVIGGAVGIGGALAGWGAWSLVAQAIVGAAGTSLAAWTSCSWRPGWRLRWSELREVSGFSLGLAGFGFVNYFGRTLDNHLVGRTFGMAAAAWYLRAYDVILQPLRAVTGIVARVGLPALAEVQDDDARMRSVYLRLLAIIALLVFPLVVGTAVVADDLVLAILGTEWSPMAPLMRIFAPVALVQSIGTTVGLLYQAKGRTTLMLRVAFAITVVFVIAIVVGLQWGLTGVAVAYALAALAATPPSLLIPFRLVDLPMRDVEKTLRPALLGSLACGLAAAIPAVLLPDTWAGWPRLLVAVLAGGAAYAGASWWLNRQQLVEAWSVLRPRRTA